MMSQCEYCNAVSMCAYVRQCTIVYVLSCVCVMIAEICFRDAKGLRKTGAALVSAKILSVLACACDCHNA